MNEHRQDERGSLRCAEAAALIHERIDGPIDAASARALAEHLGRCRSCSERAVDLEQIHGRMRAMPRFALPEEALAAVWARTVDAGNAGSLRGASGRGPRAWRLAVAAAAVVAISAGALFLLRSPATAPPAPSPAQLAAAERQLDLALQLTGRALNRSREIAYEAVIEDSVAPVLERVPLLAPPRPKRRARPS